MRCWCCNRHSTRQSTSGSSVSSSSSSESLQNGHDGEGKQQQQQLANGGKRRRKGKGTKLQLRTFGVGIGAEKPIGASDAERRQPEGILKGTHQRSGRPPGRAVQYAEGTQSCEDDDGQQQSTPMLGQPSDASPTCSSPTSPVSSSRCSPMDQYGPMLLRPCKKALLVLHHSTSAAQSSSNTPSTSTLAVPDCPFVASLRHAGWDVQACTPQQAPDQMRHHRPVLILLEGRPASGGSGWPKGAAGSKERALMGDMLRTLREELDQQQAKAQQHFHQHHQGRRHSTPGDVVASAALMAAMNEEDVLFAWLLDKMPNERRLRQMAKLRVQQFFLRTSTDISLCEQFSRLSSRLRAVPALFAVVEEAQQPIKICDERNIVQYVNKAYELLTGRNRTNVLGSDGAVEIGVPRNHHNQQPGRAPNHVATAAIAASATAAVTAAISWSTVGTPPPPQSQSPQSPPVITTTPPMAKAEMQKPIKSDIGEEKTTTGRARAENLRLTIEQGQTASGAGTVEVKEEKPDRPPPPSPNPSRRRSSDWQCIAVPTSSNSHQYVYVKRGSADAAFFRADRAGEKGRSPGALVDAPITEALSALGNILHRCDDETQTQLREAMRILSSSELYTPTITRFRENDRIASGYYDGLIRLHHPNRQRKRSVVDAFRDHQQRRVSAGSNISGLAGTSEHHHFGGDKRASSEQRRRVSTEIMSVLEREQLWDFDVIELERVTDHHPLSSLGQKVFERWNVCEALHCAPEVLHKWLAVIEANYQSGNAYHNATHAADVLQATSYFLNSDPVGQLIQDQHAPAALIAATVHDLDHPGRGNAFLMNTRQRLALLYNDHSILENHHVALAFQLTLSQPGVNIFAQMPREEFTAMRQAVIDMVLATDMSRHFEHLAKFQQLMAILPDADEDRDANSLIICRMMVKCADIANPTREWKLCHQWAMRIVEEYFDQTAEEIERKLPVTMKGFDRETCNVPLTQCTFADMFARETFSMWCEFADLPHLLTNLEENYVRWKAQSSEWDPKKRNKNLLQRLGDTLR